MRTLSVFAFGLLLMSAGQLCAQTTEIPPKARDPFGPGLSTADTKPQLPPPSNPSSTDEPTDQATERTLSQPEESFPPVVVTRAASEAWQRIERALNRETTLEYLDLPLKDVVEDISFNNNIPMVIDTKALEELGIDMGMPITRSLKGVSLRSALRLMLRDHQLTFVIRDEVLQITTQEVAESKSSIRFYRVTELLPPNGDGETLVELIKTLVAPATWCGPDCVGSIIYVEHLESLAIRQTDEVLHQIEELLATTKKLAEMRPSSNFGGVSAFGGTFAE